MGTIIHAPLSPRISLDQSLEKPPLIDTQANHHSDQHSIRDKRELFGRLVLFVCYEPQSLCRVFQVTPTRDDQREMNHDKILWHGSMGILTRCSGHYSEIRRGTYQSFGQGYIFAWECFSYAVLHLHSLPMDEFVSSSLTSISNSRCLELSSCSDVVINACFVFDQPSST